MELTQKVIYVLIGPSGAGKSTIGSAISSYYAMPELISHTTRHRRAKESDTAYYFCDDYAFDRYQYVEQTTYAGYRYGLSVNELNKHLSNNNEMYVIMDKRGAQVLVEYVQDHLRSVHVCVISIGVSLDSAIQRMILRGDSNERIISRLSHYIEHKEYENYKHAHYHIINDGTLTDIISQISKIILEVRRVLQRLPGDAEERI